MNTNKDVEFNNFLKRLREKLKRLAKKYPMAIMILAIYDNKVKIYVQDSYNHFTFKKVFHISSTKRFISYLIDCHIQEPPDYDLPINFKIKPCVAYYFIGSNEVGKI